MPILITIECRKRKSIQDILWIEQLISKKANIGAAKTIAVSSVGFTKNAIQKAEEHGIELRTCKYLNEQEIQKFFFSMEASIFFLEKSISFVSLKPTVPIPFNIEKFTKHFNESIEKNGMSAIALHSSSQGRSITFNDLFDMFDGEIHKNINRVIKGESPKITINGDDGDLCLMWNEQKLNISQMTIGFSVVPHHKKLNKRTVIEYKSNAQTFAQSVEMSLQIDENSTLTFSYIQHPEST